MVLFDKDTPIQQKLMTAILLTSGAVLLLTCTAFFAYDVLTFRHALVQHLSSIGELVASNSTAALAFDNAEDATEILAALDAEPSVVAAALYDENGRLFAHYPANLPDDAFPPAPGPDDYNFADRHLSGFQPVEHENQSLGTLYLQSGMEAIYERLRLYGIIATLVVGVSFLLAYLLSRLLQRQVSSPILALAETAGAVSNRQDYSVRAAKMGNDEVGLLTDAFNQMLTQIQEQDQALRESEERSRLMIESVRDYAILMMDPEGYILNWNEGVERLHGYAATEILGQHFSRFYPEEMIDSGMAEKELRIATEQGRFEDEGWRVRKDGSRFWANVVVTAVHDEDGHLRGFSKVTRDITERWQAEANRQAQLSRLDLLNRITHAISERQNLRSIFRVVIQSLEDHLPIDFGCVYLYDAEHDALTLNSVGVRSVPVARDIRLPSYFQVPGNSDGLARSLRHGDLVCEPDLRRTKSTILQRMADGGLCSLVVAPLLVESKIFGILVAARREADSFTSTDCEFLRQLSEHVALAAHQAQLHEALQQAFDDLRQTQQAVMQQERLRALGQMASGIAHDINNAISPVALYTESLLENEPNLSGRARGYLETIQHAIDDVAATVSRVREFYRRREEPLMRTPVRLNTLVQQVLDLTRVRWSDMPQQRGAVVEVNTELAPDLPAILGVESELREALTNLIFNAVDAMPEGGTLTLRTRVVNGEGGKSEASTPKHVQVEVTDTGVGMDEDTRRRALEPFFTTKGDRGTGLGLAMVYGAAQRHGATVELDSVVGSGTTIRLRFPVAADAFTEPVQPEGALFLPRMRILVVDDDPLLLKSLRDTLEGDGHVVLTANSGQTGVQLFRAAHDRGEPVSAVITDLGMPYMDGSEVAAAVKELSPSTPVILLTGWGQRLLDEGETPPGVDRVLSKPPRLRELREALAETSQQVAS